MLEDKQSCLKLKYVMIFMTFVYIQANINLITIIEYKQCKTNNNQNIKHSDRLYVYKMF